MIDLAKAYTETDFGQGVLDDIKEETKIEQGKIVTYREQDVQPYLDANRRACNDVSTWRPWSGKNLRPIAEIPMILVEKWRQEGFDILNEHQPDYQKKLKQRLNSNEFSALRTSPGRV